MTHPIRKAKIHTFERKDTHDGGAIWIAKFYPYETYPAYFVGVDEQAAIDAAEAQRTKAIADHEADCIRRQEMAEANRKRAAEKKAAKQSGGEG